MIGSGTPISQSNAPFPKPMTLSSSAFSCHTIRTRQKRSIDGAERVTNKKALVLLSQKAAGDCQEYQLFGKIHCSAYGT
jgi:hypothetical protein